MSALRSAPAMMTASAPIVVSAPTVMIPIAIAASAVIVPVIAMVSRMVPRLDVQMPEWRRQWRPGRNQDTAGQQRRE